MTSQELKQKTRFCKDCKFCELGTFGGYEYAECTHAEFQESRESQNKITGEVIKEDIYHPLCHLVRSEEEENYESCGEEGLLFVSADEHSTFVTVLALSLFILFIISLILIVVARC